jgi:gliding motility-associated lipoprotein GldD
MKTSLIFLLAAYSIFAVGCSDDFAPKPKAYARIELPAPVYQPTNGDNWNCPYSFEFSTLSYITLEPRYQDSTCWYNLYYPRYRATVHLTYSDLNNNLTRHIEESRKLAMKHIGKASQIEEILIENDPNRVYGLVYNFSGETASDMQFFLTDSTHHFLRGALYFNVSPNKDSLAPVISYIKNDIQHLVNSVSWTSTDN